MPAAKVPVAAVLRAARVLEAISHAGASGVREVARRVGADPSTVHRTLHTLEEAGFLVRDPKDGTFAISPKLGRLAQRGLSNYLLLRAVSPHLRDLYRRSGGTVLLAVPDGDDLVFIERLPPAPQTAGAAGEVQMASGPGYRVPLHATGAGKAYLAALEPERRREQVKRLSLARLTRTTITEPGRLLAQLEEVARRGWAVNDEEFRPEMRGVAACIRSGQGPLACISVTGPLSTMSYERIEELGPLVAAVALRVSREQGWDPA